MSSTRAAIRYAKAILDIAISKNATVEVNNDMYLMGNTILGNQELSNFIQNPIISVEVKQNALLEIFRDTNSVTKSLLHLLFQNKRFEILESITKQYTILFNELNNNQIAFVTTAIPLDENLEVVVKNKIATFTTKNITIQNSIDPSIIGGFILRIGDMQYNASVTSRLQTLKRELSN